jgi:hypothetical protein
VFLLKQEREKDEQKDANIGEKRGSDEDRSGEPFGKS